MTHEFLEWAWSIASLPVANHILQSTMFAGLAALLTLAVRNNRAQIRHSIWLAASLKFLIPLSVLFAIGGRLAGLLPAESQEQVPRVSLLIEQISQRSAPVLAPLAPRLQVSSEPSATGVLIGVWFLGFLAVAISWLWRWRRVASALKSATVLENGREREALLRLQQQAGVRASIRVAVSRSLFEPGVFGIRRPVLILPEEISGHLEPEQLEAVLAHEIVHVRRRDNLFAALHMIVEAVFWFHPLVWWLGAKLVAERERACDEEVLRLGSQPEAYAEGILRVCKFCLASPLPCVSGVTGADLKRRIEQIMSHRVAQGLNRARKLLLAGASAAAVVIPIAVGLLSAPRSVAQQTAEPADRPSFAVASIKPSDPEARGIMIRPGAGGRFSGSGLTLRFLIKFAYDLHDDQISGGPSWLDSKHYDIDANSDPPFGGDPRSMNDAERNEFMRQIRLRLQSLLADRFQLKISHATKEMSVYHLVVAKNGPKLKEAQDQAEQPAQKLGQEKPVQPQAGANQVAQRRGGMMFRIGGGEMDLTGADMEAFARALSEMTGRTVIDKTGLTGHYDIKVEFTPDPSLGMGRMMGPGPGGPGGGPPGGPGGGGPPGGPQTPPSESTSPTLLTALQEQLGLKLESHKGPGEVVNVDSAQFPSEN
jgi:uncharacterized protein (TIGR03435 family)